MNTVMKAFVSLLVLGVASCATTSDIPEPEWLLNTVGGMYVGRPVQEIAARYGAPHTQQDFQGEKIYSWHANTTMQWRRPVQSTTTGRIGDESQYPWARSVPYRQTTTTDQLVGTNYHCRMDVYVQPDGTIRTLGFFGKMGACKEFNPYR